MKSDGGIRTSHGVPSEMPCGCYSEYRQGNTQATWLVTAEAFLCKQRHKQGQVVVLPDGVSA